MDNEVSDVVLKAITRLPDWIRHELGSKDSAARLRAEETLAAIIVSALAETEKARRA